jgi:uncharacterized protein (TIGR02246 family)
MTTEADIAAIAGVIADVERGFNTKDAELSVAHFLPDATAVGVRGELVTGRDALLEAHRAGYAGPLRDMYVRYELGDVRFLRPDVAVAYKHATATTREGEPLDVGHAMISLYVLVHDDGRWRIAARHNTLVT